MHDSIRINRFNNQYDNAVKSLGDTSWSNIVQLLSEHMDTASKDAARMFNLVCYESVESLRDRNGPYGVDDETLNFVPIRRLENILQVDALVLDFDGDLTLDQARKRFEAYEYCGYTSYRHGLNARTHKFRLIFALAAPIPVRKSSDNAESLPSYGDITDELTRFAGPCDPASFNPNQIYYFPSTDPKRKFSAESWHNTGKVLDWRQWPTNQKPLISVEYGGVSSSLYGSTNLLSPDQPFQYSKGVIHAKDVVKRLSKVVCPFHNDTKGGESITRYDDSGIVAFRCKRCGVYVLPPSHALNRGPVPEGVAEPVNLITGEIDRNTTGEYQTPPSRTEIGDALSTIKKAMLKDDGFLYTPMPDTIYLKKHHFQGYNSHVILMPEGAGKSRLALDIVLSDPMQKAQVSTGTQIKRSHRVVFACRSWRQVFEQYEKFAPDLAKHGLYGVIAYSKEGALVRRFDVRYVRRPAPPFETGDILKEQTLQRIYEKVGVNQDGTTTPTKELVDLTWQFIDRADEDSRFARLCQYDDEPINATHQPLSTDEVEGTGPTNTPSMVFTTFARLRLVGVNPADKIPIDWTIWIDDPDVDDLLDIVPMPTSDWSRLTPEQRDNARTINDRHYFARNPDHRLGEGIKRHRCIYTTTELVTSQLIQQLLRSRKEEFDVHDYLQHVPGGRVTILGTENVRRGHDALIPLFVRRLDKNRKAAGEVRALALVADGLGSEFNHSVVKGNNSLADTDLVIEISKPHFSQLQTIADALGENATTTAALARQLMLDRLHQAIGRNSGYRTQQAESVVLVDRNDHRAFVDECRYFAVDRANSVLIDRLETMRSDQSRLGNTASPLACELDELINQPWAYLGDKRKSRPDIQFVVESIKDENKRLNYLARLLFALTNLSGIRFDQSTVAPKASAVEKVYQLGHWILEKLVDGSTRDRILKRYGDFFKTEQTGSIL